MQQARDSYVGFYVVYASNKLNTTVPIGKLFNGIYIMCSLD